MQEKCHLHCVSSQRRSSSCVYFGSPPFALLRCATAFSWHYTSHKSDTHGKYPPTAARTRQYLGAAGPKLCLTRAVHEVLSQPKTNWEAVPQCQFWNHFSQHLKLQLAPLHSSFPPVAPEENLGNQCQLCRSLLQATGHTNALIFSHPIKM